MKHITLSDDVTLKKVLLNLEVFNVNTTEEDESLPLDFYITGDFTLPLDSKTKLDLEGTLYFNPFGEGIL